MSNSSFQPRRRGGDHTQPNRRLQNERPQRSEPNHHHGVCKPWPRLLELPVKSRDVSSPFQLPSALLRAPRIYQECIAKSLTEKFGNLNLQMDKVINDANGEIDALNQRLQRKRSHLPTYQPPI